MTLDLNDRDSIVAWVMVWRERHWFVLASFRRLWPEFEQPIAAAVRVLKERR